MAKGVCGDCVQYTQWGGRTLLRLTVRTVVQPAAVDADFIYCLAAFVTAIAFSVEYPVSTLAKGASGAAQGPVAVQVVGHALRIVGLPRQDERLLAQSVPCASRNFS